MSNSRHAGRWDCGVDRDTVCAQKVMDGFIGPGKIELYPLGWQDWHVAVDTIVGQYEAGSLCYPAGILCFFVVAVHASLREQSDPARLVVVYIVTGSAVHLR